MNQKTVAKSAHIIPTQKKKEKQVTKKKEQSKASD